MNNMKLIISPHTAGIFFSTYESTKSLFSRTLPIPEPLVHSAASGIAEMASCLVITPAEVIKQNAQMLRDQASSGKHFSGSTSMMAFRQLGGPGAWQKLFTGYSALVARNLPFTALQFPLFEHFRAKLWRRRRGGEPGLREKELLEAGMISAGSAGSAGAFAAFITTPSDVVKTRMMLFADEKKKAGKGSSQAPESESQASRKQKATAWEISKSVYRERGLRGFFRGGLFRSAWTALGSGLYLGTYDVAKVWLKRRKPDLDDSVGL